MPIEIKKGAPDVSHALKQLQAGAHQVQEMVAAGNVDDFRAVLVSGSPGKNSTEKLKSKGECLTIGPESHPINSLPCNSPFTGVFDLH